MVHYVKPTLEQKPDNIIVHTGTNNLRQDSPQEILNKIVELCENIKKKCPQSNIAVSKLTPRRDFTDLEKKRLQVNEIIRSSSQSKPWTVIPHKSLDDHSLNTRGIHLNRRGASVLAKDFINFVHSK